MAALQEEMLSLERQIEKETLALSIILAPISLGIMLLGALACSFGGNLTTSCMSSVPIIYAVVVVATFFITFQATHYLVEFLEYRRKNKHLPLKEAVKISIKHTQRAELSETLEHMIQPVVKRLEDRTDSGDQNAQESHPPVKIIDTDK